MRRVMKRSDQRRYSRATAPFDSTRIVLFVFSKHSEPVTGLLRSYRGVVRVAERKILQLSRWSDQYCVTSSLYLTSGWVVGYHEELA